ncbi:uncharacterized protein LOC120134820 [Hibiscus syriacus]|uniref:uncharacterized protein LOC120134820 n=1 Tax=Hibiscus syriacus TaxID=106335 RepID=UPI0019236928|nr:uncharacterized protein LOC120134820 [Hibiscus syriacus]
MIPTRSKQRAPSVVVVVVSIVLMTTTVNWVCLKEVRVFLSGNEEFDNVSEREGPLGEDPRREISLGGGDGGGVSQSYKIYVDDDDEEDGSKSNRVVVPIAQLSMDDEVSDEMSSVDETVAGVEEGEFSGVVKVAGGVESSPRLKVASGVEDEEVLEDFVGEDKGSDFEVFDEMSSEDETVGGVEDGGFSGVVNVAGSVESSPRLKVASGLKTRRCWRIL